MPLIAMPHVDSLTLRIVLWTLALVLLSCYVTSQAQLDTALIWVMPLDAVVGVLCGLALYFRRYHRRKGTLLALFLSVAHCATLAVYGLCCKYAHNLILPCLPAVLQLVSCLVGFPLRFQILPLVAAVGVPLATFRDDFAQPIPTAFFGLAVLFTLSCCPFSTQLFQSCPAQASAPQGTILDCYLEETVGRFRNSSADSGALPAALTGESFLAVRPTEVLVQSSTSTVPQPLITKRKAISPPNASSVQAVASAAETFDLPSSSPQGCGVVAGAMVCSGSTESTRVLTTDDGLIHPYGSPTRFDARPDRAEVAVALGEPSAIIPKDPRSAQSSPGRPARAASEPPKPKPRATVYDKLYTRSLVEKDRLTAWQSIERVLGPSASVNDEMHHSQDEATQSPTVEKERPYEEGIVERIRRNMQFKQKYEELKETYDVEMQYKQKAAEDFAEQRLKTKELKSRYDHLQEQMNEAVEGKRKADEDAMQQSIDIRNARVELEEMTGRNAKSRIQASKELADQKVAMNELKEKYDELCLRHEVVADRKCSTEENLAALKDRSSEGPNDALREQQLQTRSLKMKYDRLQEQMKEAIEGKQKADEDLLQQCSETRVARLQLAEANMKITQDQIQSGKDLSHQRQATHEMKSKFDDISIRFDQENDYRQKAESDLTDALGKAKELKNKYDELKENHDREFDTHRVEFHEMKVKYDHAHEQMVEVTEGKRKADEDLVVQEQRTKKLQFDLTSMKAEFDENVAQGKVVQEQMDRAMEGKRKADEDLVVQEQRSQKLQFDLTSMKAEFDENVAQNKVVQEQMDRAIEGKRKADEDLVVQERRTAKFQNDLVEMKETYDQSVAERQQLDSDLVRQRQKGKEMKLEFDSLKRSYDQNIQDKVKVEGALTDQREQTKDAQRLYSAMKNKYESSRQQFTDQQSLLSQAENHIKVLRWMLPETADIADPPTLTDSNSNDNTDEAKSDTNTEVATAPSTIMDDHKFHASLSHLSHEMRTPLTTAISALEILTDTNVKLDESDRQDLMQKGLSALQSLLILVNNLLDLNKLNSSGIEPVAKQVNLRRLAIQVVRAMEVQAKQEKIELVLEISPLMPTTVRIDRFLLQRVLTNLLANAVQFSPSSGRVILKLGYDTNREFMTAYVLEDLSNTDADETSWRTGSKRHSSKSSAGLSLTISEQLVMEMGGSLEHTEDRDSVQFELPAPTERNIERSIDCVALVMERDPVRYQALVCMLKYIGVFIMRPDAVLTPQIVFVSCLDDWNAEACKWKPCKAIICLVVPNFCSAKFSTPSALFDCVLRSPVDIAELRGVIRSVVDTGDSDTQSSRASSSLGTASSSRCRTGTVTAPTSVVGDDSSVFIKALLVEDNAINHTLFLRHLKNAGVSDIRSAHNGAEAIKLAEKERFSLIIMDVEMPELSGIEATKKIRKFAHHEHTPIVGMTADESSQNLEKCRRSGIDEVFTKPIRAQSWQAMVKFAHHGSNDGNSHRRITQTPNLTPNTRTLNSSLTDILSS